ncbi:major tail protein [Gordonia phage Mollymur]|uniref:Major tail protein n=1 Tax=Gordonia phage Mollymur TaxID=2590895 RepID=A0A4Y6EDJ1_9CAUD|nr:major tail protein [Gordonia phage Mollymur]QDF15386.1 major tail protein [Gordonia phage Mollymur]
MADTPAIKNIKKKLIRKAMAGAVLFAPDGTTSPTSFTTGATSEFTIPVGFESLGAVSREGSPTFTPETENSDVDSWGELESTRTDIISRNTTIAWTSQETKKKVLELYHNVDLSAIEADAITGEVQFADPTSPDVVYHRALFVGIDGAGANAIYVIRYCPQFIVTEVGEQQWGAENAIEYPFTGRAKVDEDLGYSVLNVFGGPGWKKIHELAGFDAAP